MNFQMAIMPQIPKLIDDEIQYGVLILLFLNKEIDLHWLLFNLINV